MISDLYTPPLFVLVPLPEGQLQDKELCPCKCKYPKGNSCGQRTLPLQGEVPEGGRGI